MKPEATPTQPATIFAFEVWIPDAPWGDVRQVINERSLGRAKNVYWRDVSDPWPDIPFTAVRGRKVGPPQSSPEFLIGVGYRGIPTVRCGDRVTWKNGGGVIVGFGGGGAWLQIIADEGWRGYVHPAECAFPQASDEAQPVSNTPPKDQPGEHSSSIPVVVSSPQEQKGREDGRGRFVARGRLSRNSDMGDLPRQPNGDK